MYAYDLVLTNKTQFTFITGEYETLQGEIPKYIRQTITLKKKNIYQYII